jgi:hypothetical protein
MYPSLPVKEITKLTSKYTSVSMPSISSALKQSKQTDKVTAAVKKQKRQKNILSDLVKWEVQAKIHTFFF